ncbi:right-handed parallel beta-helix repeat-containing protein [Rhodopila globiformis]|nr:right-handed parallel beta-helix repeat-containing protein [Rhodopila globiformis]
MVLYNNKVTDMPLPQCLPRRAGLRFLKAAAALAVAGLATACLPVPGVAATLEVGPGKTYAMPSAAIAAAQDGDHIVIAAGNYFDCAFVKANNLTIEGAGPDATVITDKVCGGKALLVIDGNNTTVRNLTLTRARVPDFNGAGIRAEGGNLTIDNVNFVNNQDGILAASMPGKTIIVRNSQFLRNGACEPGHGCAHGLYVGQLALLRVEHSKFFETKHAHHIKSRAARTEVIGCDLADGPNGNSSYAVEIPNGGAVVLRDNHIEKGPKSENHTAALMIGTEGITQPTPEILVEHNTFEVDGNYNSYLVDNMTATPAELKGNILKGNAKALHGDGEVQ